MVAASARLRRSPNARAWIFLRAHAELVPMLLLAPAVAVLAAFLTVPLVYFGIQSFQTNELVPSWTLDNYAHFFGDSLYLRMLGQSIWLGLQTTLLTLLLGYPLAYHLAFTRSRFKPLLLFFLISPLLVGVVIRCYGWMILLSDNGLINQWLKGVGVAPGGLPLMYNTFGILLALVHVFLPYMVLSIVGVLRRIDPALVEAAQNLGASRPRILWEVIWPLTIPGVAAGCLLVFSLAMRVSLQLALASTVITTVLGTMAALILVRYDFPDKDLLNSYVLSPLILPQILTGVGLLAFFSRMGLTGSFQALLLGHIVICLPYVVRTVVATLYNFDRTIEEAAKNLGASP